MSIGCPCLPQDRAFYPISSVAGVYTPAFVERIKASSNPGDLVLVSPEFILRPSLSVCPEQGSHGLGYEVSPEFILRPSLSDVTTKLVHVASGGVAGVYTPAFVERRDRCNSCRPASLVSPEFILRPSLSGEIRLWDVEKEGLVSPEFILRPSLSESYVSPTLFDQLQVSPEFILRPSLSAPA